MAEWISVKDRMPEKGSSVLIYSKEGKRAEGTYMGGGRWMQYRWSCYVTVTHWMPLPEPPEVKR